MIHHACNEGLWKATSDTKYNIAMHSPFDSGAIWRIRQPLIDKFVLERHLFVNTLFQAAVRHMFIIGTVGSSVSKHAPNANQASKGTSDAIKNGIKNGII